MSTDALARNLHDRATRGEALSTEEKSVLSQWYSQQDMQEASLLAAKPQSPAIDRLRTDIGVAVKQLRGVTERIESLTAANDSVRHEIMVLQFQLAKQASASQA